MTTFYFLVGLRQQTDFTKPGQTSSIIKEQSALLQRVFNGGLFKIICV